MGHHTWPNDMTDNQMIDNEISSWILLLGEGGYPHKFS